MARPPLYNGPYWVCRACQQVAYGWTDPAAPNLRCPTCH